MPKSTAKTRRKAKVLGALRYLYHQRHTPAIRASWSAIRLDHVVWAKRPLITSKGECIPVDLRVGIL